MNNPKISIIIPVYNVEKYLQYCLDSIIAQTFTDWECICVDDGSSDASGKILDEYAMNDERFVVIHQENRGVSSARNTGLDIARGEWISFIDSDDMITMDCFAYLVSDASSDLNIGVLESYYTNIPFKGKIHFYQDQHISSTEWIERVCHLVFSNKNSVYCPRTLLLKKDIIGMQRFDEQMSLFEDVLFYMNVIINTNTTIAIHKEDLYLYRIRPGSLVRSEKSIARAVSRILFAEKVKKIIPESYEPIRHRFLLSTLLMLYVLIKNSKRPILNCPYADISLLEDDLRNEKRSCFINGGMTIKLYVKYLLYRYFPCVIYKTKYSNNEYV